jgi:A/G-specific adenine glycosylase
MMRPACSPVLPSIQLSMPPTLGEPLKKKIRRLLLEWFRKNRRTLPWRQSRDPYRIWISEIMLQQTQVAAVIPYFERFLDQFPTLQDLAQASLPEVLRLWAGLGYYSRARNLKKAAVIIFQEHQGVFPRELEQALALPGIGRYTAGAILSIAFGRPHAVVDGNVTRVLSRLLLLKGEQDGKYIKQLWRLAGELLPVSTPGEFNEGLMELGATVCLPRHPQCAECPLKSLCQARMLQQQESLPVPKKKPAMKKIHIATVVVSQQDGFLMVLRKKDQWLQGFWEFPQVQCAPATLKKRLLNRLRKEIGFPLLLGPKIGTLRHGITCHQLIISVYLGEFPSKGSTPVETESIRWVKFHQLDQVPLGAATRRIAQMVVNESTLASRRSATPRGGTKARRGKASSHPA